MSEARRAFGIRLQKIVDEAQRAAYETYLMEGADYREALLMASIEPEGFGDDPDGTVVSFGTCADVEGLFVNGLTGPDNPVDRTDPFAETEVERQELADLNLDPTGMMFWLADMTGGGDDLARTVMEIIYQPTEKTDPKLHRVLSKVVPRLFLISREKLETDFDYEISTRLRRLLRLGVDSPIQAVCKKLGKMSTEFG